MRVSAIGYRYSGRIGFLLRAGLDGTGKGRGYRLYPFTG
jgi:hypothetical protein